MIKNVIFDLGGILIDDGDNVLNKFLGLSSDERRKIYNIAYNNPLWSEEVMLGKMSQQDYLQFLTQKNPTYEKIFEKMFSPESQTAVLPILSKNLAYAKSLRKNGKYKIYILSNLTDTTYDYVKNIRESFDGGAYSCVEGLKKPDKEFYRVLLKRYQLKPDECVFFDDREANIQASKELGMHGVLIRTPDELLNLGQELRLE